jgi:two-component system, OmpR family, response regulator
MNQPVAARETAGGTEPRSRSGDEPRLVLIVDDDPDFLFQHSTVFQSLGFDVITADARDKAEALLAQHAPDLAVIDLMMEESDSGFTLCHEIKRRYPHVPVVVVTSAGALTGYDFESLSGDQRTWIQADAVLSKPIRFDQLKGQVDRLLDR